MSQCTFNTFCCSDDCDCQSGTNTISFEAGTGFNTIEAIQSLSSSSSFVAFPNVSQPIYTPASSNLSTHKLTSAPTHQSTSQSIQTGESKLNPNSVTDRGNGSSLGVTSTATLTTSSPIAASRLSNSNENIKMGLGIGVSLGLSVIAIIIFSFWREHRLKNHMQELRTRWVPVSY